MTAISGNRVRIQISGLCKTYPGRRKRSVAAVENVSFEIKEGEFVALIGPSGCGKSTILNMAAGLLPLTSGSILIDNLPVHTGHVTPGVGYVFQRDTAYPWRTVARNVGYGLELGKVADQQRKRQVDEFLRRAGLQEFANAFPLTLSGGMRQRVALMRTLIMRPEILLMDEPFGALDTHTKLDMHKLLLEIWQEEHQTVIFVTHDLGEALTLSDRIIVLSARPGRIKEIFDVGFERPRDAVSLRETRQFADLFSRIWHSLGEEFKKSQALG